MFITNLHKSILGIDGRINLAVGEVNRYIDDTNAELVSRVRALESAKLISVSHDPGMVKTGVTGKVVSTVCLDTGAVTNGPRSAGKLQTAKTLEQSKIKVTSDEKPANKSSRTRRNTKAVEADISAEA